MTQVQPVVSIIVVVPKCALFIVGFPFIELRIFCQREAKSSADNLQTGEIGLKLAINVFLASVTACG